MKKLIYILPILMMLFASCKHEDNAVERYMRLEYSLAGYKDSIESIRSQQIIDHMIFNRRYTDVFRRSQWIQFCASAIDADQLSAYLDSLTLYADQLEQVWTDLAYAKQLKKSGAYPDDWRETWMVEVKLKSGEEHVFRVLCNEEHTPCFTEGECESAVEELRADVAIMRQKMNEPDSIPAMEMISGDQLLELLKQHGVQLEQK